MATTEEKRRLISTLAGELREENLGIFCGAGLSVAAGFVNWMELLRPIAEELGLDIEKEKADLVALAQYHCNSNLANRGKLNQLLISNFCRDVKVTANHKILARLPVSTYWTTNYDKIIETALIQAGKIPDVKYTTLQLAHTKPSRDAIVYKMHGDVDHPSEAVLTKDDYERYHVKMQPFLHALSGDLISKTFLFLGFSFTDPNLDYILSRVRVDYGENQRQHYCILRSVQESDCRDRAEYEYNIRKQGFFIQDLLRYGIKCIMIDAYAEITEILQGIERQHRRNTVFISGAATDYSPFEQVETSEFIYNLSKTIIEDGFKIVSGFGLGIGSSVIAGALEPIYMTGATIRSEQLVLRPFPQTEGVDRKQMWTDYRNDMISFSGIAIFVFGNKLVEGKLVLSNGMREEFEIAKSKGLFLLPIGATGYMAKELWTEVNGDFDRLNPDTSPDVKTLFEGLGGEGKTFKEIYETVVKILTKLKK